LSKRHLSRVYGLKGQLVALFVIFGKTKTLVKMVSQVTYNIQLWSPNNSLD